MSRKVENSAGAGLNGGSMGDIDEALEVVGLAGGLLEFFLDLGIVATLRTSVFPGEATIWKNSLKLEISTRSRSLEQ